MLGSSHICVNTHTHNHTHSLVTTLFYLSDCDPSYQYHFCRKLTVARLVHHTLCVLFFSFKVLDSVGNYNNFAILYHWQSPLVNSKALWKQRLIYFCSASLVSLVQRKPGIVVILQLTFGWINTRDCVWVYVCVRKSVCVCEKRERERESKWKYC